MGVTIRPEREGDERAIFALEAASFETDAEARLVDALRASGALRLSLVACEGDEVVGHIAFSPVELDTGERHERGVGLGPMAVVERLRGTGVGGRLVHEGLEFLRERGERFCVVLGHADYYPRFGFERASQRGIRWEHPVPEEVFFVQELAPAGLEGVRGVVRYRPEFDAV